MNHIRHWLRLTLTQRVQHFTSLPSQLQVCRKLPQPDSLLFATTLDAAIGLTPALQSETSATLEVCSPVSACQNWLCTHQNLIQILGKWYLALKEANIRPPHFAMSKSGLSSQTSPSGASLGFSCAVSPAPKAPVNGILCRAELPIRWSW